jgi:RNA polymerase-binding transcription factor DksA
MATKKSVPAKKAAATKKVAAAKAPVKPAAPAKKVAAKAPAKPAVKAAPAKKASVKAPAKPTVKAPAKPTVKAPAKPTVKAPAKPIAKAPAKKATPAKKVAKAPAKPIAKAVPAKKVAAKAPATKVTPAKATPKATAKAKKVVEPKIKPVKVPKEKKVKVVKEKVVKPPKEKKAPARKQVPTYKSNEPVKRIIEASISEIKPKKTIAEKFPQSEGTIIAHRHTSEMKRREKEVPSTIEISPSYNRSLLDTLDDAAPRFRYSDDKLAEFKVVIYKKLEIARKELDFLQGIITRKNEAGTEDTENKFASMEDGSASQDREMLNQLASRQISLVEKLEQAIGRVENKTYGVCRTTGKLIEENRLKAVPHATLSMEAKNAR